MREDGCLGSKFQNPHPKYTKSSYLAVFVVSIMVDLKIIAEHGEIKSCERRTSS